MATLKDVAKLACVDVSTVSRALNNSLYVHPETKRKVLDAAYKLGYRPNILARGLRQGKSNTIGIVIPRMKLNLFSEIAEYIELEAKKSGYGAMICNTLDDHKQEAERLNHLNSGLVDGIIISSTGQNKTLLRNIRAGGLSVVQVIRVQDETMSGVAADYFACAYDSVKYLASRGCGHIGLINGDVSIIPYRERYCGYHRALKDLGLNENVAASAVPKGDHFMDGYEGTHFLLRKNPLLDAVMVSMDMQGIGVMRALREAKIDVPGRIKVISLTGHSIGGMLETAITSMEIPAKEIAQAAVKIIIEEIAAGAVAEPRHITFKSSLIVRETT